MKKRLISAERPSASKPTYMLEKHTVRVTFDMDPDIHLRLTIAATRERKPLRELVSEILDRELPIIDSIGPLR
jgi:predicted HicB family RNase H-like nuclease